MSPPLDNQSFSTLDAARQVQTAVSHDSGYQIVVHKDYRRKPTLLASPGAAGKACSLQTLRLSTSSWVVQEKENNTYNHEMDQASTLINVRLELLRRHSDEIISLHKNSVPPARILGQLCDRMPECKVLTLRDIYNLIARHRQEELLRHDSE